MNSQEKVLLTETVQKGGCAAKLPAGLLRSTLKSLLVGDQPQQLIVGAETMDDASLWDLGDGRLLVQTLDFFTPMVDDAEDFGAIAAANSMSDVFAMGGTPKTALTILCFPTSTLSINLVAPLMKGAIDKIREGGACLTGGHSIDDDTLKLGFSVAGFVAKDKAWTNAGAKPGDVLILTKGLGTGTICSGIKNKVAKPDAVAAAIASMKQLNKVPELLTGIPVHAATDITGFGLAGHAMQVANASNVTFSIKTESLPSIPGAKESLAEKVLNRAHKTNGEYVTEGVIFENTSDVARWLTLDPQTSGGILLSVPAAKAREVLERLRPKFSLTQIIGEVLERQAASVHFSP